MFASERREIPCGSGLDSAVAAIPPGPAVFAIWPETGDPYLGRAWDLRRRLTRLLRQREQPGRMLNLRDLARRIEFWPVASRLESWLVLYECAKRMLPGRYMEHLKLRMPPFLRLAQSNPYPRTSVTTRTGSSGLTYGPFRTRAIAEQFEHRLLDLFQIRRCQEDLVPGPEHPGCIYGEMDMCLRPCQNVVGVEEYAAEAERVADFLRSDGRTALRNSAAARDRLSAEMDFENAAREHKRVERIEEMLRLREDLARDTDRICGIAVAPAVTEGAVSLWPLHGGLWQLPVTFPVTGDRTVPLDRRLRECLPVGVTSPSSSREQSEHLAILARWFYSNWRDGVWVGYESRDNVPWRRLGNAVSKVVHQQVANASHSPR